MHEKDLIPYDGKYRVKHPNSKFPSLSFHEQGRSCRFNSDWKWIFLAISNAAICSKYIFMIYFDHHETIGGSDLEIMTPYAGGRVF